MIPCRSARLLLVLPRTAAPCTLQANNIFGRRIFPRKIPSRPFSGLESARSTITITMPMPPMPSAPPPESPTIKTRILILSDTHSTQPQTKQDDNANDTEDELSTPRGLVSANSGFRLPLPEADVVLHCGDLTRRGRPDEVRTTFAMLRALRAPLKLVIAGNHDLVLDEMHYRDNHSDDDVSAYEEARQIVADAEADGVRYLEEGTYTFDLANGARLRVFASPWTPMYGYWAFQYDDGNDHSFDIPDGVDIAMTHGPPKGIRDRTSRDDSAGCGTLFRSICRARPKIHCFGHIHEAWGAELIRWRGHLDSAAVRSLISPVAAMDLDRSRLIYALTPPPEALPTRTKLIDMDVHEQYIQLAKDRGCYVDLTEGENTLVEGEETLFVNASIMSVRYRPTQMPWVVDVDLPRAAASQQSATEA